MPKTGEEGCTVTWEGRAALFMSRAGWDAALKHFSFSYIL